MTGDPSASISVCFICRQSLGIIGNAETVVRTLPWWCISRRSTHPRFLIWLPKALHSWAVLPGIQIQNKQQTDMDGAIRIVWMDTRVKKNLYCNASNFKKLKKRFLSRTCLKLMSVVRLCCWLYGNFRKTESLGSVGQQAFPWCLH